MLFSLSLSQTTNFTLCQTESFQTTISDLKKWKNILRKGRKHLEKRGNRLSRQFLLFPQCFQKTCTADTLKPGLVWERVQQHFKILSDRNLDLEE